MDIVLSLKTVEIHSSELPALRFILLMSGQVIVGWVTQPAELWETYCENHGEISPSYAWGGGFVKFEASDLRNKSNWEMIRFPGGSITTPQHLWKPLLEFFQEHEAEILGIPYPS